MKIIQPSHPAQFRAGDANALPWIPGGESQEGGYCSTEQEGIVGPVALEMHAPPKGMPKEFNTVLSNTSRYCQLIAFAVNSILSKLDDTEVLEDKWVHSAKA